jgi:hypothetical protein
MDKQKPGDHVMLKNISNRIGNFINSCRQKRQSHTIKQETRYFELAWVPVKDPPAESIYIRSDNLCLKRMVDPLTDTPKEQPAEYEEGVGICDALEIENKGCNRPDGPDHYKYVVPILYLQPGENFVHLTPDQLQTKDILLKCADSFLALSDSNREIANQSTNFYHRQMAGKMAQTQKHCAVFLIEVANALPSIHPDLEDVPQLQVCPMPASRLRTNRHHPKPVPGCHSDQDIRHLYRDDIRRLIRGPAELKKSRHQFCKNTSSVKGHLGDEIDG